MTQVFCSRVSALHRGEDGGGQLLPLPEGARSCCFALGATQRRHGRLRGRSSRYFRLGARADGEPDAIQHHHAFAEELT